MSLYPKTNVMTGDRTQRKSSISVKTKITVMRTKLMADCRCLFLALSDIFDCITPERQHVNLSATYADERIIIRNDATYISGTTHCPTILYAKKYCAYASLLQHQPSSSERKENSYTGYNS